MTDRDIIIHLAEKVMGWRSICVSTTTGVFDSKPGELTGTRHWPRNWNPLESIADAFEVQASLPEDRRDDFIGRLERACVSGTFEDTDPLAAWKYVTATPRQRCLAAVEVTR